MSVAGINAKWHPDLSALNLSAHLNTVAVEDYWWQPTHEATPHLENGMYYSPMILLIH